MLAIGVGVKPETLSFLKKSILLCCFDHIVSRGGARLYFFARDGQGYFCRRVETNKEKHSGSENSRWQDGILCDHD